MKPTTVNDINKPECEARQFTLTSLRHSVGRSPLTFLCPFCSNTVHGYLWSMSGGGKRCGCGAICYASGNAYRMPESVK